MTIPDWLCIGAGKSGTTSLAVQLAHHPDVFVSPVKEPRHFLSVGSAATYCGPWDDELESFRHAGEGAPVRWLHQVV